jgi:hypothetical protein
VNLFHLSDAGDIARFEPPPSAYTDEPVVWAIAQERIANYLTPRDCPRVCFRAGPESTRADIERFLGGDEAVVAIEAGWLGPLQAARLYRYDMPGEDFVLQDQGAGYWVARDPVVPLDVHLVDDLPGAIAATGAALRVLPALWTLHDAVRTSSLVFSMIRMRNATERD